MKNAMLYIVFPLLFHYFEYKILCQHWYYIALFDNIYLDMLHIWIFLKMSEATLNTISRCGMFNYVLRDSLCVLSPLHNETETIPHYNVLLVVVFG